MFTIIGGDGKEYGPVSSDQIRAWLAGGRANLETKVKAVGSDEWRRLGDLPEFAGGVAVPVVGGAGAVAPGSVLPLAGRWHRLGAILLDSLISCGVALPGFILLGMSGMFNDGNTPNMPLMIAGISLCGVLLLGLLIYQIYLLSTRGQTLGKKFLGIRIVRFEDEGNPGFVKVFLLRAFVNGLFGAVPFVGGIYSLVDICFIFRDDKRCIHDLLAGTKVVQG